MKKLILTFFGILISFSAGAAVNLVNAISTDEELIQKLFTEAGVSTNFDNEPGALTSLADGEIPFNNVYLFMYKNVREGPKEAAIAALALNPDYYEYGVESLEQILIDGDLSPMKEYLGDTVSQNLLSVQYAVMQNDYQEELEFQMENRKLSYEALATEIFMNNDLSDSANVDLLFDLDIINYLLFGDYIEYPDRSGTENVELASEDDGNDEETPTLTKASIGNPGDSLFTKYGLKKVRRSNDDDATNSESATTNDNESSDASSDSELICEEDEELSAAIDEYEETDESEENESSDEDDSTDSGGGSEDNEDEDSSGGGENDDADDEEAYAKPSVDDFVNAISGNLGNWDRELPCNETFCITVELIAGEDPDYSESGEESYEPEENCIACHIQFLNKRLEETMSKQLVAGKVSMNWGEDGTCKEAGNQINLDFNVYTILKPIFTDPGDDIEEEAENNVNVFIGKLKENGVLQSSEDLDGVTQEEYEATRILNTYEGATQEEILQRVMNSNDIRRIAIEQAIDDFEISVRGGNGLEFKQQVIAELSTFRAYFDTFQQALQASLEPLKGLADKKYCK